MAGGDDIADMKRFLQHLEVNLSKGVKDAPQDIETIRQQTFMCLK